MKSQVFGVDLSYLSTNRKPAIFSVGSLQLFHATGSKQPILVIDEPSSFHLIGDLLLNGYSLNYTVVRPHEPGKVGTSIKLPLSDNVIYYLASPGYEIVASIDSFRQEYSVTFGAKSK